MTLKGSFELLACLFPLLVFLLVSLPTTKVTFYAAFYGGLPQFFCGGGLMPPTNPHEPPVSPPVQKTFDSWQSVLN